MSFLLTLLHGETLLVVTTGNLENVALELVTKSITLDFSAHALIIKSVAKMGGNWIKGLVC